MFKKSFAILVTTIVASVLTTNLCFAAAPFYEGKSIRDPITSTDHPCAVFRLDKPFLKGIIVQRSEWGSLCSCSMTVIPQDVEHFCF